MLDEYIIALGHRWGHLLGSLNKRAPRSINFLLELIKEH